MNLLKKIINKLKIPKEGYYLTQLPPNVIPYLNKKLKDLNAQQTGELVKLRAELERIKENLKKEKEEEKIEETIAREKQKQKPLEAKKELKILFNDTHPIFSTRSNEPQGDFVGFKLKETDNGITLWYPLIKKNKKLFSFPQYALTFNDVFNDQMNIVSQLKSGTVKTNFDITDMNKPILIKPKYINPETGSMIEIRDLGEHERKEFEHEIAKQEKTINNLYSELMDAKTRDKESNAKVSIMEVDYRASMKERDIYAGLMAVLAEKQPAMVRDVANAVASIGDTTLRQILGERAEEVFKEKYHQTLRELEKSQLPGVLEPQEKKIMGEVQKQMDAMREELPKTEKTPPPPPEEETKKERKSKKSKREEE